MQSIGDAVWVAHPTADGLANMAGLETTACREYLEGNVKHALVPVGDAHFYLTLHFTDIEDQAAAHDTRAGHGETDGDLDESILSPKALQRRDVWKMMRH